MGVGAHIRRAAVSATLACVACVALCLALVGCGAFTAPQPLEGTKWRLAGWSASSLDPASFEITADFADGRISGRAAVNTYKGTYGVGAADSFSTGDIARTEMAGPEPAMRAEGIYFALLAKCAKYEMGSSGLILSDAGGNQQLIFQERR